MNVRLFDDGPVHGAGKLATTCGVTKLFARSWLPTEDPVTCKFCRNRRKHAAVGEQLGLGVESEIEEATRGQRIPAHG